MKKDTDRKTVLLIGNCYTTIASFRKELVIELIRLDYNVVVSFPNHSHGESETGEDFAKETGCHFVEVTMDRRSTQLTSEIRTVLQIRRVIDKVKPSCVLFFTIKPNIYGGLLADRKRIPYIINITGLGSGLDKGVISKILRPFYIHSANNADVTFFQNKSDYHYFINAGYLGKNALFVPGSGVNLMKYHPQPFIEYDSCTFLYTARVMKEKGIEEFIAAARAFENDDKVRFEICGDCEERYEEELYELDNAGIIKYHGRVPDVIPYLKRSSCVVIPTFYHEGVSNCLLEAAACSRAIITTNRPGSAETVDEGKSGLTVDAMDAPGLIDAIKRFVALSPEQRKQMGIEGRKKVEKGFDRKIVVDQYTKAIDRMTGHNK